MRGRTERERMRERESDGGRVREGERGREREREKGIDRESGQRGRQCDNVCMRDRRGGGGYRRWRGRLMEGGEGLLVS